MISLFGSTGFIGSKFYEIYEKDVLKISRDVYIPESDEILYMISTVDNYNIHKDLHIDINTNLNILMNVLEHVKQRPNAVFNFVSSWFVYGQNYDIPFNEDKTICKPTGFYSITKHSAEQMLICFCETFNIKYRIFRLSNVLGTGDNKISKKKNALQFMVKEIVNENDVHLYYNGEVLRDYIHVEDVCKAIKLCIEKAPTNEIINIGSGTPFKFRDMIDKTIDITKSKSKIIPIEPTRFHNIVQVRHSYLDTEKLKNYGFKIKHDMNDILNELILFYKKQN
jgi:nucleoside-diphosphate-sugar epimerase